MSDYSERIIYASQFQGFQLERGEREIYNDIRANCDITEILTLRPDATPEYFKSYTMKQVQDMPPSSGIHYSTAVFEFESPAGAYAPFFTDMWVSNIKIKPIAGLSQATCEAIEAGTKWQGVYGDDGLCYLEPRSSKIYLYDTSYLSDRSKAWAYLHNSYGYASNPYPFTVTVEVTARYFAFDQSKRYIKLRAIEEESAAKFGRRTEDLDWPLGMAPAMMQAMIENERDKYCGLPFVPCLAMLTVEGKDDEAIELILSLQIDDRLRIIHEGLEMDEEFFVNNLAVNHDINGLLEGVFQLEQARANEKLNLFIIGLSLIGGDDVIAP